MGLDEPVNLMDLAPSQPKTPEEYFSSVRHTPGMWAVNPRFSDACALVTGFFEGRGGWPIHASFTLWLADRFGGEENVFWGCHVLWIALPTRGSWYDQSSLSPDDDAAATDKLFELLLAWAEETDMGLKRALWSRPTRDTRAGRPVWSVAAVRTVRGRQSLGLPAFRSR